MKQVTLISLRTADGRHVGLNPAGDATLVAGSAPTDVFERVELDSGGIALRSLTSGWYLSAGTRLGLAATAQIIGPTETFAEIGAEGGQVALHLLDGAQCLSAGTGANAPVTACAASADAAELFRLDPVSVAAHSAAGCCGLNAADVPDPTNAAPGTLWDKLTHSEIVENGVHLLRSLSVPEATEFIKLWDGRGFDRSTKLGLADADEKSPWTGTYCAGYPMFEDHFYDPDTGRNYTGRSTNAMTLGRLCFNLAVHFGRRIYRLGADAPDKLYQRAGNWLGLSLHFLTDLTQPMHAANFTNGYGETYPGPGRCHEADRRDLRHMGFEEYSDSIVKGYFANYPRLRPEDLALESIADAGKYLHDVAAASKRVFVDGMRKTCLDKVVRQNNQIVGYIKEWTRNEADPALELCLRPAPRVVARYLAYWTRCIMGAPGIDTSRWYKILDASGRPVCLRNGHFIRGNEGEGDNAVFYFLVNPDGTFSMACRESKADLWKLYWNVWEARWMVGDHKNARGEREDVCRFLIVPGPNNKVWFFDSNDLFAAAIGFGRDDCLQKTYSDDPATYSGASRQLFTLVPRGMINKYDRDAITDRFPDFGKRNWWGDSVA